MLDEQRLSDQELREIDKVFIVACGTAYHSGLLAKYAIEHWTRLPVEVELASEFRYRDAVLDRHTLVVAISQSGETADTLEAVRHAKEQKARVLAICNTNGRRFRASAMRCSTPAPVRRSAWRRPRRSSPRSPPITLSDWRLRRPAAPSTPKRWSASTATWRRCPTCPRVLETVEPVSELARRFAQSQTVLFLGRHVGYPVALEGALKLKELAYMHAEGFAAGELKHGRSR